jgi:GNAT superfamily N-acetyltransferase
MMWMETLETGVGSEDVAEKGHGRGLQILFKATRLQPNDDTLVYYGTIRSLHVKVGEFVARVDRRSQALFIDELFVERGYRGKGIGKKVLDFLEDKASSLKIREVVLEPSPIDPEDFTVESLRNWYKKHDYVSRRRSIFAPSTNLLAKVLW